MPLEIPGYYYDPEKNKYFKVEKSQTAPTSASWSSASVKRRKLRGEAVETARQRAQLTKDHIRRHGLRRDVVAWGMLARESEYRRVAEPGWGRLEDGDVGAAAWARGVVDKGYIPFVPSFVRSRFAHMPCFYVGGEDCNTELGIAYATLDEETLVGTYIGTDDNEKIQFMREATPGRPGTTLLFRTEMIHCPQMSSIKYHKPSHHVLLTSREPDHSCGLYFFSPPISSNVEDRPYWLLGETSHCQRLSIRHRLRDGWIVHQSTPAPASSDLLCVIGTNAGILCVRSNETMSWISTDSPPFAAAAAGSGKRTDNQFPHEIFDQDFQQSNHNILLAGGRQPRLWITDLRTPEAEWSSVRTASSVAHLRSVNPHQVLVAGLQNSMSLYDMRYFGRGGNGVKPLLDFPDYRNEAHFHTGWDVCPELGVVAAAQDNGTVKLFSLKSGRVLRGGPAALDGVRTEAPIKAMMFQRLPRERLPSLFLADGPVLRKFSFGTCAAGEEE